MITSPRKVRRTVAPMPTYFPEPPEAGAYIMIYLSDRSCHEKAAEDGV
jgi:hypothetical protein